MTRALRSAARHAALASIAALTLAGCGGTPPANVAGGEPARFPEYYARSLAALGYPGARRAFQVGPGSVLFTGETALEWRLGDTAQVTTSPVWFERDGAPVAHWELLAPGVRVRFEAAAAPAPGLGDSSLVASVLVSAECTGETPADVRLAARVRGTPDGPHAIAWDAPERWEFAEAWQGAEALRDGRTVAAFDPSAAREPGAPTVAHPEHASGEGPGALAATYSAHLAPGATVSWHFWMPLYPVRPGDRAIAQAAEHARVTASARQFWRGTLNRAAALETPDTLVNAAWRAAIVTLVQCQEKDGGRWLPIGNPFQYRDVWLRDGARVLKALAEVGLQDFARDGALNFAGFQFPSGALLSQRGQLDGTGQALWAWDQVSAIGRDSALAREMLPFASQAEAWIARQRVGTARLHLPWPGLLPFADPRDGELVRAQLVGNDAWAIAGLDAVAALARRAGDHATADHAAAEARDYRATFAASLRRAGGPDIPPSWQGVGRDWGNASVGYPTRALALDDPRLERLTRRMLSHGGGSGLTSYGADDSLHTYSGADLAQWALHSGRPAIARAWLDGILAHSSSTLGQAELFSARDRGFGTNLPPHATAAACLIDLLRSQIASDWSDTLEVGLGADTTWWRDTRLARIATRFGATSVALDRPDPGTLRVRLDPIDAPLCVTIPPGLRAVEALTAGARVRDAHRVDAPPRASEVRVRVEPESRR